MKMMFHVRWQSRSVRLESVQRLPQTSLNTTVVTVQLFQTALYVSAVFVIFSVLRGVYFGHAGPVQANLKQSKALQAENDACPPAV